MTSRPVDDATTAGAPEALVTDRRRADQLLPSQVCPFILGADRSWTAVQPSRSQGCSAVEPPASLATAKQRQLCLTDAHERCATYAAARELQSPPAQDPFDAALWAGSRMRVVTLDPVRTGLAGITSPQARSGGQALLIGLMVVAFLVLVVARTTSPSALSPSGGPTALPGGNPGTPAPSLEVTPSPVDSPTPSESLPAPGRSAVPTSSPAVPTSSNAAPTPSQARTYKVQRGDTLSGIAIRFGVTVKELKAANGISGSVIRPGQVLVIP